MTEFYPMVFVACGLNHKTAPLEVREKVALPLSMQERLLHRLVDLPDVHEALILSTCNRTEIYCDTSDPTRIEPWLAHQHQLGSASIAPYFYQHHGHQGIRHTLRVASGLDSMMLGEPQIFGQLKQAYQQACRVGTVKNNLQQIFQYVFSASKRIRTHSGIGKNPVSIAYAAVQLIHSTFSNVSSLQTFIIGSGETANLVAKYLKQAGVHKFMIASRTQDKTQSLADRYAATALTISDIPHYLPKADVIISATSCPLPFISKTLVEDALNERSNAPMFFLDLAVPRDIEANVRDLNGVHLYNIDDLQQIIEKGVDKRRAAALKAEQLLDSELDNFIRQHRTRQAKEVICNYRSQMHTITQQELKRARQKLLAGQCQFNVLEEFSQRLLKKLTHTPTVGLRQAARENHEELLDLARYLLDHSPYEKIS